MAEETGLEAVVKLIQNLGLNEEMWRGHLGDALAKRIKETDLKDAGVKMKEFAGLSADKVKAASQRNPKLFYSGLAAVVLGAGLMARAARETGEGGADSEFESEDLISGTSSRELRGDGLGDEVEPRAAGRRPGSDDDLAH